MKSRPAICAVVIVAAILLTFGRTITFDFVGGWDDSPLIYDNPLINPPTGEGFLNIWRGPHARMYIPAVYSTWWMLARVASVQGETPANTPALNPYIFHAANLIVHTVAALIVFAILRILVRHDWPAAAGAIFFAVHPLQVEPVAWATGMKDLLSGAFSLAAIWQYLAFTTAPSDDRRRRTMHYSIAIAMFVVALLAKPSSVVVPFMLLAIEWLMLGRPIGRTIGVLLPWVALSAAWMIVTARVQPTPEIPAPPPLDRMIVALNALGFYVLKLIWPATLGIDYGQRPDVLVHRALLWFAILAASAIGFVVGFTRSRWLAGAALIFAIALLPTLGLKPFVFQWLSTVADRYAYLAMLGPAIALAMLASESRRPAVAWACAIVLLALAGRSFVQAGVWRDGVTLMRHALTINPDSPVALNQIGDALFRANDIDGAHDRFAHAVRVCPNYLVARDNLGVTLMRQGRNNEALELMRQTLLMRRALPPAIAQPIDQDLERIAAVERTLSRTPTAPTSH